MTNVDQAICVSRPADGCLSARHGEHREHVDDHFHFAHLTGRRTNNRGLPQVVGRDVSVEEHPRDIPHRFDHFDRIGEIGNHDLGSFLAESIRALIVVVNEHPDWLPLAPQKLHN